LICVISEDSQYTALFESAASFFNA
jgi:hypothetical protein